MYDPNAFYTPPQPEYYPRYPAPPAPAKTPVPQPPQDHDWQPQATERQSRQLRSGCSPEGETMPGHGRGRAIAAIVLMIIAALLAAAWKAYTIWDSIRTIIRLRRIGMIVPLRGHDRTLRLAASAQQIPIDRIRIR